MTSIIGEHIGMRPTTLVQDEEPELSEDEDMSDVGEPEKDATEEELERLVFGDTVGFRNELKGFKQVARLGEGGDVSDDEEEEENALAAVDSADLFFLDSGPTDLQRGPQFGSEEGEDDRAQRREPPAWEDSDDDRLQVSLMAVPRLRKLRRFEGEDIVSGREYTRRLRKQFEVLNPRPEWASWSPAQRAHKKRRLGSAAGGSSSEEVSSDDDNNDLEDEDFTTQPLAKLLRSSEALTRSTQTLPNKRIKLRPDAIAIERMKDIKPTQPSAITSLSIHPTLSLLLSSGPSSTLHLHHLHPHPTPPDPANPLITSLHLKHTPLSTTAFSTSTSTPQIYLSSRRRYFHIWDLPTGTVKKITRVYGHQDSQRTMETLKPSPCGRYVALQGSSRKGGGVVNVLDANTMQWIAQVRVESRKGLADFAWWADGNGMCVVGKGGEVSEWSAEEMKIVARWQDEGAVGTTTIALGGHTNTQNHTRKKGTTTTTPSPPQLGPDRWIAIGSSSGIVNIYDRSLWASTTPSPPPTPTPTKVLDNLTTPISHLVFSPCGQLLAMSSRWKRDALRLVHLPSCAVYRNWPTSRTPLGRVSAVAIGECGGEGEGGRRGMVVVVGNEAGVLRGWEITG